MFKVKSKITNKVFTVYDVVVTCANNVNFLVYSVDNWVYLSADYFKPYEEDK